MSKKLYVSQEVLSTGQDLNGPFVLLKLEIITDSNKTVSEVKLYVGARAWFNNLFDDYAYTDQTISGKYTIHVEK